MSRQLPAAFKIRPRAPKKCFGNMGRRLEKGNDVQERQSSISYTYIFRGNASLACNVWSADPKRQGHAVVWWGPSHSSCPRLHWQLHAIGTV